MCRSLSMLSSVAVTFTVAAPVAFADDLHVPEQYSTIQAAINAASDGDEVVVAPGTYDEAVDFLGKGITLRSSGGREVTTIDGSDFEAAVITIRDVSDLSARVQGFTIRGGSGNIFWSGKTYGGGVHIRSCYAEVADCHVLDNHPAAGGGIAFCAAWGIITNCLIEQNTCYGSNSSIGAGVYVKYGPVDIVDTVIRDNHALSSTRAGGLGAYMAQVNLRNCLFDGNSGSIGGACLSWFSAVDMSECTLTNNFGEWGGGALCSMTAGAVIDVRNSILWNNSSASGPPEIRTVDGDDPVSISHSIVKGGYEGENVIDADPMFQENCYRLTPDSPAVNAGSNDAVESDFDLDGNPRIADPNNAESTPVVDLGAYELQPSDDPSPEPCLGDADANNTVNLFDLLFVLSEWGGCAECESCGADFNEDCVVALDDLLTVLSHWGETCD